MQDLHDKRQRYYCERIRLSQQQYPNCPFASLEVALTLAYSYDILHTRVSQRLSQYGLSSATFNVMMILRQYGPEGCPLHEIGELLLVSRANVTGLIDSLEAHGFVQRVPDPHDRRVRLGILTQSGQEMLDAYLPSHYENIRKELSGLTEHDKTELSRLLKKLCGSVQHTAQ